RGSFFLAQAAAKIMQEQDTGGRLFYDDIQPSVWILPIRRFHLHHAFEEILPKSCPVNKQATGGFV
ncbi:MAG: hypothetical protein AAFO94_16535, partial [Bacteroidota bacterium]